MAASGTLTTKLMQQQQVIENFVNKGIEARGTFVKTDGDVLYSKFPQNYRPWGSWDSLGGQSFPLAVRLGDGNLLVNGARLDWPVSSHQTSVLRTLETAQSKFGVVPFHSIVAAWTDGKVRDWNHKPIPTRILQREVAIVVPSTGERWQEVTEKDKYGGIQKREIHTLGDSVVRVHDRYYLSAVDETGVGAGMYFLAELATDQPPASLEEAFNVLKPKIVREAEARGTSVRRQGEWFTIPTRFLTSQLLRDVHRGLAVYRQRHVLGKDGHHELEEAVIYRVGSRRSEVYARGVLKHTKDEHRDLDLGTIRWHQIVHKHPRCFIHVEWWRHFGSIRLTWNLSFASSKRSSSLPQDRRYEAEPLMRGHLLPIAARGRGEARSSSVLVHTLLSLATE